MVIDNNTPYRIAGFGKVKPKMLDGTVRTLDAVRHVLDLKKNLIFLINFDLKGYKFTSEIGS